MVKTSNVKAHLIKKYTGKQFTSADLLNSYRLQLIKGKTPANVKAGMILARMKKEGFVKVVGEKDTGVRGVNNKVYVVA